MILYIHLIFANDDILDNAYRISDINPEVVWRKKYTYNFKNYCGVSNKQPVSTRAVLQLLQPLLNKNTQFLFRR